MKTMLHLIRYISATLFFAVLLAGSVAKPRHIQPVPKPVHMVSSYYGEGFDGRLTASGTRFNRTGLTAAHRTLPFGTRLFLTNPKNRRSVTVEVTDRGPYSEFAGVRYFNDVRDLDVSEAAARRLGFERDGVTTLMVQRLPPAGR